ncbi:MAG: Hpt domain-containing protein, partial [Pseudomonadota bacterium]
MNDFAGMEDLLSDFLMEAGDMLSDVDSKLMELEKRPQDAGLLNEVFRGFHTIKGGAGFLNANELVTLCHLTENLFDKLRNKQLVLSAELMDVIFAATSEVRRMFGSLQKSQQPSAAPDDIIAALQSILDGKPIALKNPLAQKSPEVPPVSKPVAENQSEPISITVPSGSEHPGSEGVDWDALYKAITGNDIVEQLGVKRDPEQIKQAINEEESTKKAFGRRNTDVPGATVGRR